MRYAYKDLGQQPAGCTAVVRWSGGAASVILLDPVKEQRARRDDAGRSFLLSRHDLEAAASRNFRGCG